MLVLSPFFNKGLISMYSSLLGNTLVERTLLHTWVKGDKIHSVLILTLCLSYLKSYCMGRKTAFFSGHLNLRTMPETGLPARKKKS
jgi:hypothetical protein